MTNRECIRSCFYRCTGQILPEHFGISEIRTVQRKPDVRHVTAIVVWGAHEFRVCYDAYVNRDGDVIACHPGCVDDGVDYRYDFI